MQFSSRVAQLGQRLTLHLEALNASAHPAHGVVMLNYPEHLVSFMALHMAEGDTTVQLAAAPTPTGQPTLTSTASTVYRLLWSHWPTWQPGERRTATVALVPHQPQDNAMPFERRSTPISLSARNSLASSLRCSPSGINSPISHRTMTSAWSWTVCSLAGPCRDGQTLIQR